ncbi:MAG: hypothetical protein WC216_12260, partial [Gallionella sp.]
YLKAAKIAGAEFSQNRDYSAFLQQLNALYRANRLFEFEEVFERELKENDVQINAESGAAIRIVAIKTFLGLRKLERAKHILKEAILLDGKSLDLEFLEANIYGLEANFSEARNILEKIDRAIPNKPYVLTRLIQVCEQMRDYPAAAGYLRHALRIFPNIPEFLTKRDYYQQIGLW